MAGARPDDAINAIEAHSGGWIPVTGNCRNLPDPLPRRPGLIADLAQSQ